MKKFQKMIAIGAAFAMAMSMGVSAFAEGESVADVTHQLAEGQTTYSTLNIEDYAAKITLGEDDTQYTVVLIPAELENDTLTDADILYLNQGEKGELFWKSMGTKAGTLTAGDYILRVGCEDGSIQEAKITVKAYVAPEPDEPVVEPVIVIHGDINADNLANLNDATAIVMKELGFNETYTSTDGYTYAIGETYGTEALLWGDVNFDTLANLNDATAIVMKELGFNETFGVDNIAIGDNVSWTPEN